MFIITDTMSIKTLLNFNNEVNEISRSIDIINTTKNDVNFRNHFSDFFKHNLYKYINTYIQLLAIYKCIFSIHRIPKCHIYYSYYY